MRDEYVDTNVQGTLKLAQQAAAAGVRHFVFMSSIAVNGPTTDGRAAFRETDTVAPCTIYGETKAAAEEGLRALASRSGMSFTIVRAPMIYGDKNAKGSFHADAGYFRGATTAVCRGTEPARFRRRRKYRQLYGLSAGWQRERFRGFHRCGQRANINRRIRPAYREGAAPSDFAVSGAGAIAQFCFARDPKTILDRKHDRLAGAQYRKGSRCRLAASGDAWRRDWR